VYCRLRDQTGSEDPQCLENALAKNETGRTRCLVAIHAVLLNEMPCIRTAATSSDYLMDYDRSLALEDVFAHIPNKPAIRSDLLDRAQQRTCLHLLSSTSHVGGTGC
jgi:hypothetical protein